MQNILSAESKKELLAFYRKRKKKKFIIIFFCVWAVVFAVAVSILYTYKKNQIVVKSSEFSIEYGEKLELNQDDIIDFSANNTTKDNVEIECDIPNEKSKEYPAIGEYFLKIKKRCKISYLKHFKLPFYDEITLKVTVKDTTPPEIKTPEKIEVLVDSYLDVEDYIYLFKVTDLSETEDLELDVSEVDTFLKGEYIIKATAKDVYDNTAQIDVKCNVIEDPYTPSSMVTQTSHNELPVTTSATARQTTKKKVKTTVAKTTAKKTTTAVKTNRHTATVRTNIAKRRTSAEVKKTTHAKKRAVKKTTTKAITTTYKAENNYSSELFSLVNKYRKQNGVKKLKPMIELDRVAYARAKEIAKNFSHTRPNGKEAQTILKKYGLSYSCFGENLGAGGQTSSQVFHDWVCSPNHKTNILSDKYKYVGSAYYYYPNDPSGCYYYWVQVFYS